METKTMASTISTVLHYYNFDISNPDQKAEYKSLQARLKRSGLELFDSIDTGNNWNWYNETIVPLHGQTVLLETEYLFNNQWNSAPMKPGDNGMRLFDWSETIYPNKKLKRGYYLEQTPEMKALRTDTCACGYCGAKYYLPTIDWCTACLATEYLTEDRLPLLRLQAISDTSQRTDAVPEELVIAWRDAQRSARTTREMKRYADAIKELKKGLDEENLKRDAHQWLIDHDINCDNVIYYSHKKLFSFGWRHCLTEDERRKLKFALVEFPYAWEFSKK